MRVLPRAQSHSLTQQTLARTPIQQNNEKDGRMKDRLRAKHVRLKILSNNEKRFYKLKAERARRNCRTKGKTEGEKKVELLVSMYVSESSE